MQSAEVTREWVTYRGEAEIVSGQSRTTLRGLVERGKLKVKRVGETGRGVRISKASLDAYMHEDGEES